MGIEGVWGFFFCLKHESFSEVGPKHITDEFINLKICNVSNIVNMDIIA